MISENSYKLIQVVVMAWTLVFLANPGITFANSEPCTEFETEFEFEEFVERARLDYHSPVTDRIKILPHCANYQVELENSATLPNNYFFEHSLRNGLGCPLTT